MDVYKVCPMAHIPRVYGKCGRCTDWFTLRKDGSVRAHLCDYYSPPTGDRPAALALMCLGHRWNFADPFGGTIQLFRLTEKGLQAA